MKKFALSVLMFSFVASASTPQPWLGISDPMIAGDNLVRNFDALPLSARTNDPQKFWSGDYWALRDGNINFRWNADYQTGWRLDSPSRERAMSMSQDEIKQLSPTEKFDLWQGRYDYPVKALVYEIADSRADEWEGICHGWAPATLNHREPTPKTMTNPDGVAVPFGSSDIKGLLSYYYAWGFQVENTHQMGLRCDRDSRDGGCKEDLNPGAFHIVLGNKIGLEGVGFIGDLDKGKEVWNHPIFAYHSEVRDTDRPHRSSAFGTATVIRVKTTIQYVDESLNFWDPILGTPNQRTKEKHYEYDLDISATGEILGGDWKGSDRPDFIWTKSKAVTFDGEFKRLGELLND